MPIVHGMKQGDDDWYQVRAGKLTASRASDAFAKLKSGGWGASRERYRADLLIERLTGEPIRGYVSAEMERGSELEQTARSVYEYLTDNEVMEVGFMEHDDIRNLGCSPDGLVGDDGLVEIKCPATHTHLKTIMTGHISSNYLTQMHVQMLVCDRQWCDFISYDDRLPPHLALWRCRVQRLDEKSMEKLEDDCRDFLREVDEWHQRLEKMK